DGVLHSYMTPWIDATTIPDPPVSGAIEWLQKIEKKFVVVIHTTRGKTEEGRAAVLKWLQDNGWESGATVEVTSEKPTALMYIDDRAYRFEGMFPTAE